MIASTEEILKNKKEYHVQVCFYLAEVSLLTDSLKIAQEYLNEH